MSLLDPLQANKAKHQNGYPASVPGEAKARMKVFIKQATVRQARQWIMSRQIARFYFCNGPRFCFPGEISIAANTKNCQRNAHEECDDYDEHDGVECRIRIAPSQLKQTRAKLIKMRQDRRPQRAQ